MAGAAAIGQGDHAVVPVLAAEEDIKGVALLVVKDDEVILAQLKGRNGFVREKRTNAIVFRMDDDGLDIVRLMRWKTLRGINMLVEVADGSFAGTVIFEDARFKFPHPARDLADGFIYRGIEVIAGGRTLNGDVIGAEKNDLSEVPVVRLDIEDDFGFNDAGVIEVQSVNFAPRVFTNGFRDFEMASGDGDVQVHVCCLHVVGVFGVQKKGWRAQRQWLAKSVPIWQEAYSTPSQPCPGSRGAVPLTSSHGNHFYAPCITC